MTLRIFVFSLLFSASQAWAMFDESPHSISGAIGFASPGANQLAGTGSNGNPANVGFVLSGLLGLGADYDYAKSKDISFGGFFRYYSVSSTYSNVSYKNTLWALGPDVKGYIQNDTWLGYMAAGIEYMSPSYSANGNTVSISSGLGVMMSMGLMYKVNPGFSAGIETMRLTGLSSSINGTPVQDYMFKGRWTL